MIETYTELKEAVANWLNRSDLDTVIPNFIANAEARLNKRVRHRDMVSEESLTFDTDGEAALPSDFLEWRALSLDTTPVSRPEFVEPDSREFMYRFRPYSVPQYYTILNGKIKVQPATDATGTLYYYAKLPALTDVNPDNWLLLRSPEVYLYAAIVEGNIYLSDNEALAVNAEALGASINELNNDGRASRQARTPSEPLPLATKTQEQVS